MYEVRSVVCLTLLESVEIDATLSSFAHCMYFQVKSVDKKEKLDYLTTVLADPVST